MSWRQKSSEAWIVEHHPYWKSDSLRPSRQQSWVPTFLLGLAYQLKLLQAAKGPDGTWRVRLSPLGRWLLCGGEEPTSAPSFPQTLMVQPNLEIIAYRQGLTPPLIGQLSLFASWKNLGAACLLTLDPESVYRALQAEQTFDASFRRWLAEEEVIDCLWGWGRWLALRGDESRT